MSARSVRESCNWREARSADLARRIGSGRGALPCEAWPASTRSRRSIRRRGTHSPHWSNTTMACSAVAGVLRFTPEEATRTAPRPRTASKSSRVRAGTAHAALVFDGEDCVGWCQFGQPEELPRIKSRAAYEKGHSALPDWRIACCFVGKGHRRHGVATAGLRGALDLIAGLGGGVVEGYPEDADAVPAGFLFNGALSTYEQLGFKRDRKIGKHRWVVTKVVAAKRRSSRKAG